MNIIITLIIGGLLGSFLGSWIGGQSGMGGGGLKKYVLAIGGASILIAILKVLNIFK